MGLPTHFFALETDVLGIVNVGKELVEVLFELFHRFLTRQITVRALFSQRSFSKATNLTWQRLVKLLVHVQKVHEAIVND